MIQNYFEKIKIEEELSITKKKKVFDLIKNGNFIIF